MNDIFFKEHDKRINEKLAGVLRWLILVPIVVALLNVTGLFELELFQLLVVCFFVCTASILPTVLYKLNVDSSMLKYTIVIAISLAVGSISVYPTVGIFITLVLGAIVSLCYSDYRLTVFACVLNYVLMICGQYFRMSSRFMIKGGLNTVIHEWLGYSAGYTIEFLVVCPIFVWIAHITRDLIKSKAEILSRISEEKTYQELIMASSKDVLYEYYLDDDVFRYFGALLPADFEAGKDYRTETRIEKFHIAIQKSTLIHREDSGLFFRFMEEGCNSGFTIRLISNNDCRWYEVSGRMIYNDNHPVKCVGRISDVTEMKMDEQEYLMNSSKDSLTGFYNRRTGIRILRQHLTEAGRRDSQIFLYVKVHGVDELAEKKGRMFSDAVLLHAAEILVREVSDMDLPIRFSEKEFILYLANRTAVMMERMMDSLDDEMSRIYTGDGTEGIVSFSFETFSSLQEVERALVDSDMGTSIEEYVVDDYRNDLASFAFNLLERSSDFESAIKLLLDRIGGLYMLDYIRIMRGTSRSAGYVCLYEWLGVDAQNEGVVKLKGSTVNVRDMDKDEKTFSCACGMIGEKNAVVQFHGYLLAMSRREDICRELEGVSYVMSIFLDKKYTEMASAARADFLTTMSHEIRTPMNSIAGFAELIADETDLYQIGMYADSIRTSANNLVGVLNDILDMSKIEAGTMEITPVHYYLHEIAEEVKNIIGIQLEDSSVSLVSRVDSRIPDGLVGDGVRIRQILLNLLNNAVKYTRFGEIGMELYWDFKGPAEGSLIGIVWDTGPGIKEEELGQIFDPYVRTEESARDTRGTGLGLAITKQLVELMNGTISLESTYGKGTKVTVNIPQGVFDAAAYDYDSDALSKPTASTGVPFTAPWARVLIVDDNELNLSVAKSIVGKYKVGISEAYSGNEAIEILKNDSDYDIIFMDYMMPDMDGIETTQILRGSGDPVLERIPIVALTANVSDGIEEKLYMVGMNGYLTKPINLKELADVMLRFIPEIKREG